MTAMIPVEENTPPMDPSTIDLILAGFEAQFGTPATPFPGAVPVAMSTADLAPGAVPISGWAADQVSGLTINVEPDGSGIAPLIPVVGKPGSVVNPAWIAHRGQQSTARVVNAIHYIPPPDTVTIFSGPGEGPTWNDVYQWTTAEQRRHMTFVLDTQPVTGAQLQAAIDASQGSVVKAMGGFVDQSVELTALLARALNHRIDQLQLVTYEGVIGNANAIATVRAQVNAILTLAIPSLQAQITQEAHAREASIIQHDDTTRQYVHDVWAVPLRRDLTTETHQRKLADQSITHSIPGIVRALAPTLGLATVASVASVATRVGTLEREAERCGKPMCSYLGPQSPLGKILSAIKWAALLALLVELGALTADDINGLATKFAHDVNTAMLTIDDLFVGGGATIAHSIASVVGELV